MEITLALPARNEAKRIESCVEKASNYMQDIAKDYEIIVAESGSTDDTGSVVNDMSRRLPAVRLLHIDEPGKGKAIREAFNASKGRIFIMMDVDLATDFRHIRELISEMERGYDIVIGSRRQKGSKVKRTRLRRIVTFCYNSFANLLFRDGVKDHQCGFKLFKRESTSHIINASKISGWFWDTEVLVKSKMNGLKIKEIPIKWSENREVNETKINLWKDSARMFISLLKLRWEISFTNN